VSSFRWNGSGEIPPNFDLTALGWQRVEAGETADLCITLVYVGESEPCSIDRVSRATLEDRRAMLICGVPSSSARRKFLNLSVGDVVGPNIEISELEARARRLLNFDAWVPRLCQAGDLELDLLTRKVTIGTKPLDLHPREFAILWRLAETPHRPVSRQSIIETGWKHGYCSETNSFAVHLSRLRSKLRFAGFADVVERVGDGYRLAI